MTQPDVEHSWTLNGALGVTAGGWHFDAGMKYRISREGGGDYKVHTLAYRYRLGCVGHDVWRLHWHPGGASDVPYPHIHAALSGLPDPADNLLSAHLPSPRMTFEQAVRWAAECGFPMRRSDYQDRIAEGELLHLQHRSWDVDPTIPARRAAPPD